MVQLCDECGGSMPNSYDECSECGAALDGADVPSSAASGVSTSSPAPTPSNTSNASGGSSGGQNAPASVSADDLPESEVTGSTPVAENHSREPKTYSPKPIRNEIVGPKGSPSATSHTASIGPITVEVDGYEIEKAHYERDGRFFITERMGRFGYTEWDIPRLTLPFVLRADSPAVSGIYGGTEGLIDVTVRYEDHVARVECVLDEFYQMDMEVGSGYSYEGVLGVHGGFLGDFLDLLVEAGVESDDIMGRYESLPRES